MDRRATLGIQLQRLLIGACGPIHLLELLVKQISHCDPELGLLLRGG